MNTTPHTSIFDAYMDTTFGSSLGPHSLIPSMSHVSCALLCVSLIALDNSIHFSFLTVVSLITLFFLLPVNFVFQDVVAESPVHLRRGPWHPGRERASHTEEGTKLTNLERPWSEKIWLGKSEVSHEHLCGCSDAARWRNDLSFRRASRNTLGTETGVPNVGSWFALGCTSLYREGEFRSGSWRR